MVNRKNRTMDGIKSEVKKRAKKVASSPAAKTVKEVGREVERTLKETVKVVKEKTIQPNIYIEHFGNKVLVKDIKERAYDTLREKIDFNDVKSIDLYFKVEENKLYCVINGNNTIEIQL